MHLKSVVHLNITFVPLSKLRDTVEAYIYEQNNYGNRLYTLIYIGENSHLILIL